jgi:rsbT co-antagonist protein RsbR
MPDQHVEDLAQRIRKLAEVMSAASVGDFTKNIEIGHDDEFTEVEMGINFLVHDLSDEHEKIEMAFSELSTPIIQIWDDVLALPIVGIVDSHRSEDMMVSLLNEVVEKQSRCVIIDITGVDVVDTKTADHFIKMVKAVKLLGAECIITGISPDIAQTLTHIGVDMAGIQTRRNVQQGLQEAFRTLNYEVRKRQ